MVHIHNGILLSHKKERIWVSAGEADEHRAYYTEWNKSEREKQILYIKAYTWNLERWYWWTYLQGSNGDADIQNRLMNTVGEGEGGTNWGSVIETYIIICGNLLHDTGSSNPVLCDNLEGWNVVGGGKEVQQEGDICMYTCGLFILIYGRNQHNIIKQLFFN